VTKGVVEPKIIICNEAKNALLLIIKKREVETKETHTQRTNKMTTIKFSNQECMKCKLMMKANWIFGWTEVYRERTLQHK
jgi:hypothetical protein